MARKKIKEKVIQLPKDNVEEVKNFYQWSIPKFRFKTIPKELIPKETPALVYYLGHVSGLIEIGLLKNINDKDKYYKVKTILAKFNDRIGIYDIDEVMLVPHNSKDFKKYERFLHD
jgi:hypothetical protein